MRILVINGPNLGSLGKRDPAHYGKMTLAELNRAVGEYAAERGADTLFFHSNGEGEIIDEIESTDAEAIIINAGAYTHYSYAIRDALEVFSGVKVEVHLSNIEEREPFRRIRAFKDVVDGFFCGKKEKSYFEAVDFIINETKCGGAE